MLIVEKKVMEKTKKTAFGKKVKMDKKGNLWVFIVTILAFFTVAVIFTPTFIVYQKLYDKLSPDFTGDAITTGEKMYKLYFILPVLLLIMIIAWAIVASQKEQPGYI